MPELGLYQAQVRLNGGTVWTAVFAESPGDAIELLEAAYGDGAVVRRPQEIGKRR